MVFGILATIGSAISSAVSSIGSAVSSFCTTVLPKIVPVLEQVGEAIKAIANVVLTVLGVFKPDENVEDIGDRVLQAAESGIKPDKFEDFEQYMEEIRNFKLDPDKSARLTRAEKLAAGLAVGTLGLEKKLDVSEGSLGPIWMLVASNPDYFNAERLTNLLQTGSNVLNVIRYFEGKLGPADAISVEKTLIDLETKMSPEKSDKAVYDELDAAKDAVRNLEN